MLKFKPPLVRYKKMASDALALISYSRCELGLPIFTRGQHASVKLTKRVDSLDLNATALRTRPRMTASPIRRAAFE
jgi:hypothetical protein